MAGNPIDASEREEAALRRLIVRELRRLHGELPAEALEATIRSGLAPPERYKTAFWHQVFEDVRTSAEPNIRRSILRSWGQALAEAKLPVARQAFAELAAQQAIPAARALAEGLEAETAEALNDALRDAVRRYTLRPSSALVEQLAAEIQPMIGATPKQLALIDQWAADAAARGMDRAEVLAEVERRTAIAIRTRAKYESGRAVTEAVNGARHEAWSRAIDAGALPEGTRKRWRDQGDNRVRALHRAQSRQGPIPFRNPYPIFGVMHPPAPEPGCRCWDEIVAPARIVVS